MAAGIAAAYLKFGELPWIQHMFYGIGAAVIAIIGQSPNLREFRSSSQL
jgi:chromate transport protein ChrA